MRALQALSVALPLMALVPCVAMATWGPDVLGSIDDLGLIYVATLRKDGTRSESAPIWFGVLDGAIWLNTGAESIKVRRIERGSPVFFSARREGPFTEAEAEVVRDPAMADRLGELYRKKYWLAWMGLFRPKGARVAGGKTVLVKLTPKAGDDSR